MARFPTYELTLYDSDDTTPLFVVSTDPGHAQPYLKAPQGFPEQEVEFARGAASIGQINVQVVDVRTDPADQATGYITARLADAGGYSQINGHRALLTEDVGGGAEVVLDGVARRVTLLDTFVTYDFELRDIRERERKIRAFETTNTPTIIPRGVLAGYGVTVAGATYPLPATRPVVGVYRSLSANRGEIDFTEHVEQSELDVTGPVEDALGAVVPVDGSPQLLVYERWTVLWRPSTGGAYTELTQIVHRHPSLPGGGGQRPYSGDRTMSYLRVDNLLSGETLPSNGQEIDVIVRYVGPVTADWRYHLEGLTVGELLRNAYRGDYSAQPPRIRYDEAALLALTTPVRMRLGEPVEDLREWTEKHAYPIAHAAPTLNADGEISPISYLLPDENETLPHLDNSNCRPVGGGWGHGTEDAINVIRVTYKRDYRIAPAARGTLAQSDQLQERDVTIEARHQASIDLIGEQSLEISSELLRAIGSNDGGPIFGDVVDETGHEVSRRITRMALDRLVLGGQYFQLLGDRADSDVENLKDGSWMTCGVSWMPDYLAGTRGLSRLAQVVSRRNRDASWATLTLLDAGSAAAPVTAPTLGTITAAADGVVSIPVSSVGSGEARVDFAVAATEPAEGSSAWRFLDRVATPQTLTTPPAPAGSTVWVRPRGEAEGRRPSAWGAAVSVAVPQTARVLDVRVSLDAGGVPTVSWRPNSYCLGVRVYYEVHEPTTTPSYADFVDVDALDLETVLSSLAVVTGSVWSVRVEPYTGWTGAAVSGSAGPVIEARAIGVVELALLNAYLTPIPFVDPGTARGIFVDLHYAIPAVVDELGIEYTWDNGGGLASASYDALFSGGLAVSGDGVERIQNAGDFLFQEGWTGLSVTVTPRRTIAGGVVEGPPVLLTIEDVDETGAGTTLALTAGGSARADMAVPGSNVTIDLDANGRPRINAAGAGAHTHAAGDITSGTLATARGGTGVSSPAAGNLLVGAGTSPMSLLAPGAAGGYARSNGSAWVRNGGVPAGDVQPGTFPAGSFVVSGDLSATGDLVSNTSDRRLKRKVGGYRFALAKLFLLQVVYYRWNDLALEECPCFRADDVRIGLFAQDVQRIAPEAIRESPANKGYLAYQPEMLLPIVVQAVQELAILVVLLVGVAAWLL